MMEAVSEKRLAEVNPDLATRVRAAHDALVAATGNGFRVAQGLRTYAEQDALYDLGRTTTTKPDGTPQPIVTNAPGGCSNHNFGCAVDCYPFTVGDAGGLDWNASDAEFKLMVSALEGQGLAWGGDWHSIKDYPHFQLASVPVSPTEVDRQTFASGGLAAVWALYS